MFISNAHRRAAMLMLPNDGGGAGGAGGGQGGGDGAGAGGGAGADGSGSGAGAGGGGSGSGAGDGAGADIGDGDDQFKTVHSKKAVLGDLTKARDENASLKQRIAELENAGKPKDQQEREAQEAKAQAESANARFAAQAKAAADAGLNDLSWVRRIAGSTPEEMLADAQALKKDLDERNAAGQTTDGAGTKGSGNAVDSAPPGVGRLHAYYATKQSN
ncbi:hypothetical protein SEA_DOGFISH_8 [Gordonia phage Dogfish]|nr:hypothetical protein SEA_DOGFISH_8 [Gordonia phage Dogfish]